MTDVVRVGMVGYAFMGAAHAQAWRNAHRFFDLPLTPELTAVAGRNLEAVSAAAERLGFASAETDWRSLVERDDIDLVDICTPGDSHAEIAIAALRAGKHVLCEKPLANSVEEAEQMAAATSVAAEREVWAMCGFTYRRTPALALARRLVEAGRIGTVRQVRAQYLQDWLHDPDSPMTWRLDKSKSGSGALGDLGAHLVDTAQWLIDQGITGVSAILETFVKSRPLSGERSGLGGHGTPLRTRRAAMSRWTMPHCSRPGSAAAPRECSRPAGLPSVARMRCGSRLTAPTARSHSTSRRTTNFSSSTVRSRSRSRASGGSWSPSPSTHT
jgi:predicted dehydrogenase